MNKEGLNFAESPKEILPPFQCTIGMGPSSVSIYSERNDFLPYFGGEGKGYIPWIPGWRVDYSPASSGYKIVFIPADYPRFEYNAENKKLTVRGETEDFKDGQALAYLGFWLMEAQRQKDSKVTAHAAAMAKDGKGVLILGERGDGKTSTILALGRKYGYRLIANDLAIFGYDNSSREVTLYDGTKIFGLRLSAVRGRFPELLHLFPDLTQRSWTTRAFVLPDQIGVKVENIPQILTKAFMVHLDSTKTDRLSVYRMDDLWVRNYLYENFSRYLRAAAIVAFGRKTKEFLDYIPSLDDRDLHLKRVELINFLIKNVGILNVSGGNLDEICETIVRKMEESS